MKIAISGCTGLIGTQLAAHLHREGHQLSILTHNTEKAREQLKLPAKYLPPLPVPQDLEGIEAVINLAGENIGKKRWSESQKARIFSSRVGTTKDLVSLMSQLSPRPRTFICSSAVGFYGDGGDQPLTEESHHGVGFLSDVCVHWEKEAANYSKYGRAVQIRTSMVLSREGGALEQILKPFRFKAGAVLGTGRQWVSWIHIHDLVRIFDSAIRDDRISGPINATAPNPVTNEEMTRIISDILQTPVRLKVPEIALKIILGEMSELVLSGQKALPAKLEGMKFKFEFPEFKSAIQDLIGT